MTAEYVQCYHIPKLIISYKTIISTHLWPYFSRLHLKNDTGAILPPLLNLLLLFFYKNFGQDSIRVLKNLICNNYSLSLPGKIMKELYQLYRTNNYQSSLHVFFKEHTLAIAFNNLLPICLSLYLGVTYKSSKCMALPRHVEYV